ncbi:MAG: hypothetical protein WCJ02_14300 [bacterium]
MSNSRMIMSVCCAFLFCNALPSSAQEVVKKLSKEEATNYIRTVATMKQAVGNQLVCKRMMEEKQKILKSMISIMQKDHGIDPDASYVFIAEEKTLFQVSTNKVAVGKEADRKLIKKFNTKEEAAPLTQLMSSRQRLERQIVSLAELTVENVQTSKRWEATLKKTFSLEPSSDYNIVKVSDSEYNLVRTKTESKNASEQPKKEASDKKEKKSK